MMQMIRLTKAGIADVHICCTTSATRNPQVAHSWIGFA